MRSPMREFLIGMFFAALIVGDALLLTKGVPAIHRWEKANGYPFGMFCEVFNNCR